MEIKNTRDMINKRNYLLKKLYIEYAKLDKLSKSPFVNRKEKNNIYENIRDYKYNLNCIEEIMIKGAKFKSSDFAVFLENFLDLTEEGFKLTKFKVADAILDETLSQRIKRKKAWKKGIHIDDVQGKWCYFISDEVTKEFIEENIFDEYDLEDFKDSEISKDVIILDEYNTYPFNYDFKMKKEFAKHKRLKTAIYELINLKIKHPELTDQERFEKVLQNTIRRNLNRSYQKKKESK